MPADQKNQVLSYILPSVHVYCASLIPDLSRLFVGLGNDRAGVGDENTKLFFSMNDLLVIHNC